MVRKLNPKMLNSAHHHDRYVRAFSHTSMCSEQTRQAVPYRHWAFAGRAAHNMEETGFTSEQIDTIKTINCQCDGRCGGNGRGRPRR